MRDDIFRLENEKRVAETVYVPDAIIVNLPKPTAEQLNSYFEANKAKFQIPEYRSFAYVLMTTDDVIGQVSVTPDQVKQEYDARQADYGTPEKRDVDQAMADSEDKAKKIIAAVQAGKSLEDATKEVTGNDSVVKLGLIVKKDLPAGALADGVFSAPQGVAPAPVQSPLGWHVIRINKIDAGAVTPLEQVKEKIEKDLKAQMTPDILIKMVTDFERALSKSQSMAKAARRWGSRSRPTTTSIRSAATQRASRS
jgi:peptidyl-prolyl cis-trans isomerase D